MRDQLKHLTRVARQLIAIEELFGGEFMPAERNPLPEIEISAAGEAAGMGPEQKAEALQALDVGEVQRCANCRLAPSRTHTVFGEGNPDADLVFIGEGPGQEEDRTGRPFVGRAGELLTKMIRAMGLTRQDVFICNMVKCRPPQNRAPMPDEVEACWDYLIRQLQILQPKAIVTLGNPATKGLLNTRTGITRLRGTWQKLPDIGEGLEGTPVMPTFHPAYVLRQYTPDIRRNVWGDLQQVMALLGIEVPKK